MHTAEHAENAEIYHEIRLSALCGLSGEIFITYFFTTTQKRSATTETHDTEALDLAFLIIADQLTMDATVPSPVSVAAPHCLSAAHS